MQNTKIGNSEAIVFILIIMINHILSNIPKYMIMEMHSSAILNTIFISIIAIFFAWLIGKLLSKFAPFDILDISKWLGGRILKFIVGLLFLAYFTFFTAMLLRNLASCLRIIYFPSTKQMVIIAFFLIAALFICNLKYNSIYRANMFIIPILILTILFIFFANLPNYSFSNIFPILGNGAYTTFVLGISNLFAFQGFAYLYFLPSNLKDPSKIKKISIISIVISSICLILTVSSILLMFNTLIDTDELLPLFSAVRYIEFGNFFQRLDSLFVLIWIIAFLSFLCINLKIGSNILSKITEIPNNKIFYYLIAILIFVISLIPKNYTVSTFYTGQVYKYSFFILVIGISLFLLFAALIKRQIKKRKIGKLSYNTKKF